MPSGAEFHGSAPGGRWDGGGGTSQSPRNRSRVRRGAWPAGLGRNPEVLGRTRAPLGGSALGVARRLYGGAGGAHHGLLHLHLDDVLVDVVPVILARDAVIDVLSHAVLTVGG